MSYFRKIFLTKNKISIFLVALAFIILTSCEGKNSGAPKEISLKDLPKTGLPELPLKLSKDSSPEAIAHNKEGISHYKMGHYKTALKYFRKAEQVSPQSGEVHFNEGLSFKFMGEIGSAVDRFKQAKQFANGNPKILNSNILNETLNDKSFGGVK